MTVRFCQRTGARRRSKDHSDILTPTAGVDVSGSCRDLTKLRHRQSHLNATKSHEPATRASSARASPWPAPYRRDVHLARTRWQRADGFVDAGTWAAAGFLFCCGTVAPVTSIRSSPRSSRLRPPRTICRARQLSCLRPCQARGCRPPVAPPARHDSASAPSRDGRRGGERWRS
jgi:hypothetical protein